MNALSLFRTAILSGVLAATVVIPAADQEETATSLSFSQATGGEEFLAQTNVPGERRRVRRRTRRRVNRRHERRENKMMEYRSASVTIGSVYFWAPEVV